VPRQSLITGLGGRLDQFTDSRPVLEPGIQRQFKVDRRSRGAGIIEFRGRQRRCYTVLHGADKTTKIVSRQQNRADITRPFSFAWLPQRQPSPVKETTMKKLFLMSAVIGSLSVAAVADANAWTRSATSTGPRGTSSVQASGSCANGTCSRSATRTGPAGNTYTRQGSISR
jgi:uncharacterized low-complexity protein